MVSACAETNRATPLFFFFSLLSFPYFKGKGRSYKNDRCMAAELRARDKVLAPLIQIVCVLDYCVVSPSGTKRSVRSDTKVGQEKH